MNKVRINTRKLFAEVSNFTGDLKDTDDNTHLLIGEEKVTIMNEEEKILYTIASRKFEELNAIMKKIVGVDPKDMLSKDLRRYSMMLALDATVPQTKLMYRLRDEGIFCFKRMYKSIENRADYDKSKKLHLRPGWEVVAGNDLSQIFKNLMLGSRFIETTNGETDDPF
jgi:hypothetical protein